MIIQKLSEVKQILINNKDYYGAACIQELIANIAYCPDCETEQITGDELITCTRCGRQFS